MKTPTLPDIPGIKPIAPLKMTTIHFDKKHTVLTPALLESMKKRKGK